VLHIFLVVYPVVEHLNHAQLVIGSSELITAALVVLTEPYQYYTTLNHNHYHYYMYVLYLWQDFIAVVNAIIRKVQVRLLSNYLILALHNSVSEMCINIRF